LTNFDQNAIDNVLFWELLATRSVSDAAAGEHPVLNTGPAPVE
jgi:hypothetical protein